MSSIPEAPTFYPTEEEFRDPINYIRSIQSIAVQYGICKIVPPKSVWNPPCARALLDPTYKTKVEEEEAVMEVETGLETRKKTRGRPRKRLRSLPDEKLDTGEDKSEEGEKELKIDRPAPRSNHSLELCSPHMDHQVAQKNKKMGTSPLTMAMRPANKWADSKIPAILSLESERDIMPNRLRPRSHSETDVAERMPTRGRMNSSKAKREVTKVITPIATHAQVQVQDQNTFGTRVQPHHKLRHRNSTLANKEELTSFGFYDGDRFTISQYEHQAKLLEKFVYEFTGLDSIKDPTTIDIESQYWKAIDSGKQHLFVPYGSDIDTSQFGSGFPHLRNQQQFMRRATKQQMQHFDEYLRMPWNLNVLPRLNGSLFSSLNAEITGVMIPWLYIGMIFASFCWHVEDLNMYSINYMHWGGQKVWYGASGGKNAALFEASFRSCVPDLFTYMPDILQSLVTMVSPSELIEKQMKIYRIVQNPGDFILTFPQAYHAGFSTGFNCAEAVNFSLVEWIPYAEAAIDRCRVFRKRAIFTMEQVLFEVASSSSNSRWCESIGYQAVRKEMERIRAREMERRRKLMKIGKAETIYSKNGCGHCFYCQHPCFFSGVKIITKKSVAILCVRHALQLLLIAKKDETAAKKLEWQVIHNMKSSVLCQVFNGVNRKHKEEFI